VTEAAQAVAETAQAVTAQAVTAQAGTAQAEAAQTATAQTATAQAETAQTETAQTETAERNRDRIARRQLDKFAERRAQLAAAALQTLAEQGYARTSLRDIAQNSEFSHGVLHYYFSDKTELITYCVRQYKAECVTRYDNIVATATSAGELRRGFGAAMAATLVEEATLHRLWYDLRNQSLFDDSYRHDVTDIDDSLERMIWRIVSKFADLAGTPLAVSSGPAYAVFDGLFQQALIRHLAGRADAARDLDENVQRVLDALTARR
jgi:AcrR family transcriptional regulator